MALNLKKKILLAAALAGALGAGAVSDRASATVTDYDYATLGGYVCEFGHWYLHREVEWGDNSGGNDSIEVRGVLMFNTALPGSCQLYIRYYNGANSMVATDSHTLTKSDPFSRYSYVWERNTNLAIQKARICTRSKLPWEDYTNYECINVYRGD